MTASALEIISEHRCFGGVQGFYRHESAACRGPMRFSVYRPPQAAAGPVPVLYYLAGLTCTEETFMIKGGAQRLAAELGLMLVAPDTSPRTAAIPGEGDRWDLGLGAGFYVDAVQPPWSQHYRMFSYVTDELPRVIAAGFAAHGGRQGIFGHSMGGHGALVCALRQPGKYRSVSAFAPIASPTRCPWGELAFGTYLGSGRASWRDYDASLLVERGPLRTPILVDQGLKDQFLESQLHPHLLEEACARSGQALQLRRHDGYDHGYYFISTFMADHLRHHAQALLA